MSKIGIIGGTFDPIHKGHIEIAKAAKEKLELDQIWVMPNSISPFKVGKETASALDRVRMCELAIEGLDDFYVSTLEVFKEEVSYTVDTIDQLVRKNVNDSFYFIIGADQAASLDKWHRIDELLKMIKIVVFNRDGIEIPKRENIIVVDHQNINISSSIEKESNFNNVEPKVKEYILERNLYGSK